MVFSLWPGLCSASVCSVSHDYTSFSYIFPVFFGGEDDIF